MVSTVTTPGSATSPTVAAVASVTVPMVGVVASATSAAAIDGAVRLNSFTSCGVSSKA